MMQITEDTPPDMLAGAMDLTVHLPTGRTVKMSVERSTPMMDLLVQITTAHHLQHSGHILQALEMAPSSTGHTDKVLPYKPNTPIGVLDTQHVKVIPKGRTVPVSKAVPAGHQPFESTFRLQVHLPRNQLYVFRVSQHIYLEDIMKKVCDEKNLDPIKYEFRHPGNLDEVLDPKLTLSDYQITEVYIVSKGTVGLTQSFSSSDIMALRKEEERKQLQARTGGGVFSLIFKKGKSTMGSGSLSSENRSISPSHSDDSRSVTPPAIQQQILPQQPPPEKPKPPQRKRRPAPKPPQQVDSISKDSVAEKPPSQISNASDSTTNTSDLQQKKIDNGLTICHSRNSSDSSGYHEPSVLSDNCNTSLPRRPKSTLINEALREETQDGNLAKMATFSKSTTSITSRKKKAAPPPPATLKLERAHSTPEKSSPVVASPPVEKEDSISTSASKSSPCSSIDSSKRQESTADTVDRSSNASSRKPSVESVKSPTKAPLQRSDAFDAENGIKQSSPRISLTSNSSASENKEGCIQSQNSVASSSAESPKSDENEIKVENKDASPAKQSLRSSITSATPKKGSLEKSGNKSMSSRSASVSTVQELKSLDDNEIQIAEDIASSKQSPRISISSQASGSIQTETVAIIEPPPKQITSDLVPLPEKEVELETEWQYQLPPPPTFRDTSPTADFSNATNYDTITLQDFKPDDSVVTSPELFEKEIVSDLNSVGSDDNKMLSKLTLENLEKRKSLVYNRELSTSLKVAQDTSSLKADEPRSNMLSELEEVIQSGAKLTRHSSCIEKTQQNNLPNFKISTYDKPKQKINIFEDDTIRSNERANSYVDLPKSGLYNGEKFSSLVADTYKNGHEFKKPELRAKLFVKNELARSESFSANLWKPLNPVQRSKSQVNLNKYREQEDDENLAKCNSLFDVSGLQSLEVMRMIQTKLQTPTNSSEALETDSVTVKNTMNSLITENVRLRNDSTAEKTRKNSAILIDRQSYTDFRSLRNSISDEPSLQSDSSVKNSFSSEHNFDHRRNSNELQFRNSVSTHEMSATEPKSSEIESKKYKYQGPPAINLSTWSERPKTKVSLKEDTDYKINDKTVESRNNVSIKVNGTESITTQAGNVVIKIGEPDKNRFTTPIYRKPLGNVNKIVSTRPHSVAFDHEFDISRVPIVRSVELKKPFKEVNTSITQINSNESETNKQRNSSVYIGEKPVLRVNSFAQRSTPTVIGFRGAEVDNTARSRKSWNIPSSYSTLPLKVPPELPAKNFTPNSNVPFSQVTLRRIESAKVPPTAEIPNNHVFSKVVLRNTSVKPNMNRFSTGSNFVVSGADREINCSSIAPPPPPVMPNATCVTKKGRIPDSDPRDELLNSIRKFGGINGLKHVKA